MACCGLSVEDADISEIRRMSEPANKRRGPSANFKKEILAQQDFRCLYCNRQFGSLVYRWSRPVTLLVNWDHVDPFTFSLDNREQNFVAACHVCNSIKSAYYFGSLDEAQTTISARWKEKGYSEVPTVRPNIRG